MLAPLPTALVVLQNCPAVLHTDTENGEQAVPTKEHSRRVLLGLEPLYMAVEGKAIVVTPEEPLDVPPNAPLFIVNAETPHSKLTLVKAEHS